MLNIKRKWNAKFLRWKHWCNLLNKKSYFFGWEITILHTCQKLLRNLWDCVNIVLDSNVFLKLDWLFFMQKCKLKINLKSKWFFSDKKKRQKQRDFLSTTNSWNFPISCFTSFSFSIHLFAISITHSYFHILLLLFFCSTKIFFLIFIFLILQKRKL